MLMEFVVVMAFGLFYFLWLEKRKKYKAEQKALERERNPALLTESEALQKMKGMSDSEREAFIKKRAAGAKWHTEHRRPPSR